MNSRKNRSRKRQKSSPLDTEVQTEKRSDYQKVLQHASENPTTYVVGTALVLACALSGGFYSLQSRLNEREVMTEYAKALETLDPALQAAALERLAERGTRWTAEATYVMGEAAIRAEEYKKAEEAFSRIFEEFGDSQYAPLASDGLAFMAENKGDFEEALAKYQKVVDDWPDTLAGKRQYLNIGRVHESLGDFRAASEAYERQKQIFPGSIVAARAEARLTKLREGHPELFPGDTETEPANADMVMQLEETEALSPIGLSDPA